MTKLKLLAAATSAALLAVGGAVAQTSTPSPSFSALDKNNDGNISQQEWNDHYRMGAASGASSGASNETKDAMQRGPTTRMGEPAVGGPRTGDEGRHGGAAAGATGAGASGSAVERPRDAGPTSRSGEPHVGGPRTGEEPRATSGATTSGTGSTDAGEGAKRGYPTAPTGNPSVGGPSTK